MLAALIGLLLAVAVVGCDRRPTPEAVALGYGRALWASDVETMWGFVSEADRRVKDEAAFRRQHRPLRGFAGDLVRQLAEFIEATPVRSTITGDRARVTLNLQLPDANASEIRSLTYDWDEARLERLEGAERRRIHDALERLRRDRQLPVADGEETFELVREGSEWRIFLNWAGGVRVRFGAVVDPGVPLAATVIPEAALLSPGERLWVTVRATNTGDRDITTRVGHRITPAEQANHLALLQCPLFLPVTLNPGETEEFLSEYLLLADAPADAKEFAVTYRFPSSSREAAR